MPVIREYQRQTNAIGPVNQPAYSPDQFGAAEGRATEKLGMAIQGASEVVAKRIDQANTSDVTAKMAKTHADLAIDLQKTIRTAEPGDNKAFDDYQKRADEAISKVGEEASTSGARAFYQEASAKIKGSLSQTAAAGQAELAGIKAVNDYTTTLNSLSAAGLADPSSLDLQRDLHRQALQGLINTGQLPREKAIELERRGDTELTKSAVRGWIDLNPDYAKQKLKSGAYDAALGADGKVQLFGEADQAIRAKEIEQEHRVREQERIQKMQAQKTQNTFLEKMTDGSLSTKDILNSNLEAFGSGSKEQFLNMMKMRNSPEERLKTDPQLMMSLFQRITLPDGDPNKITNENDLNSYFGNGLSLTDLNHLRGEMQGKNTEQGRIENQMKNQVLEIAKGKLTKSNPLTGFKDPIGDEQMTRFMGYFYSEYQSKRAQGKTPESLLSPDSPDYLGKNISQYVRTNQQIMRDLVPKKATANGGGLAITPQVQSADAATPGVFRAPPPPKALPRQPGESAAAYLKRIKGGG